MRTAPVVALLCALALALAACGGNGGSGDSEDSAADGSELPDDVAATVNGEKIPASQVDKRVEAALSAAGDQVPQEQKDQIKTRLRTRTLQQAIVGIVLTDAAKELGVPVEEGDVQDARSQFAEQAGGKEELQKAIDESGMSEDQLDEDLRATAAFENIKEALAEEAKAEGESGQSETEGESGAADTEAEGASTQGNAEEAAQESNGESAPEEGDGGAAAEEGNAPQGPQGGPEPGSPEALAQDFLTKQLKEAEIVVHPDYGRWNSEQGQLLPPEGAMQMPTPQQGGGQQSGGQQSGGQQSGGQ